MPSTHNTSSKSVRAQAVELLNKHMAAAIDLRDQLKQAHGNVRGPTFIAVHQLFDRVAGEAETYSDLIAERAAGLGRVFEGAAQVAGERSFLIPYLLEVADESEYIFALAATLAAFGQSACDAIGQSETIGDADTADLFTEILRRVGLQLRLVESQAAPV